ncbi:MAG TPA: MmcQ/YjbR family DNA-binding protein [Bacteroidetes bacterium]|nr:MmcQ/YjbR family DNA-binding protein [Bacteroidota bacterium]
MNLEEIREYCLGKKDVTEEFPFDESTLVFKVGGKMFALLNLENPHSVNLKCDPEKAVILREQYPAVLPGYHMNKKYWNTVMLDGSIPGGLIRQWIDHSWNEVVKSLPLYRQKELLKK